MNSQSAEEKSLLSCGDRAPLPWVGEQRSGEQGSGEITAAIPLIEWQVINEGLLGTPSPYVTGKVPWPCPVALASGGKLVLLWRPPAPLLSVGPADSVPGTALPVELLATSGCTCRTAKSVCSSHHF